MASDTSKNKKTDQEIIEKLKQKLQKISDRKALREKNLDDYKKYDLMEFERAKFETIQKSAKKFSKITQETKADILADINNYNFSKLLEEIIKSILDSKFDIKDISSMIEIISELHQIYDKFRPLFFEGLLKLLNESYLDFTKQMKPEEEEKKILKRKTITKLIIECYLNGIIIDFTIIKDILSRIWSSKNTKQQFFQEFPIWVYIMKVFCIPLFNYKTKTIIKLIEQKKIENFNIDTPHKQALNDKYYAGLKDFYWKKIWIYLEEEHTSLSDLEKKNYENIHRIEKSDSNIEYQKARGSYLKYISWINDFAETMNFEIPELANEKTFRYEDKKKSEMKLEKKNKYDPFSDEAEYKFYTSTLNLQSEISNWWNNNIEIIYDNENAKFESWFDKILKADSKEIVDEISISLIQSRLLNKSVNQDYLIEELFYRGTNSSIKYCVRWILNMSQYFTDIAKNTCSYVVKKFYSTSSSEVVSKSMKISPFEEKMYITKFICELLKFELLPFQSIFDIIQHLLNNFSGRNIDILCNLLNNCGRFLYLNDISHVKFSTYIDSIKKLAHNNLSHDERAMNAVNNSLTICRPQERSLHKKVKIRTVEEEYVRFLWYHILKKDTIEKVSVLLRRMNWKDTQIENIIFKEVFKYLNKGNEMQIKICCSMLGWIKDYHPMFIYNWINITLEQIRIGLERNDFNDNQHKIVLSMLVGYLYMSRIINNDIIYYTMYMILTYNPMWNYGSTELIADNPLDNSINTFRILMIVTILDICGTQLYQKRKSEKKAVFDEFIHFLQIYILTKQFLPLDIENRVTNCWENWSDFKIYDDFHWAMENSKSYKGIIFGGDDNSHPDQDNEDKSKNKTHTITSSINNSNVKEKEEDQNRKNETSSTNKSGNNVNENGQGEKIQDEEFKRSERPNKEVINIDEEINKIISESWGKAKGSTNWNQIINPYLDIKKKELNKSDGNKKFKLFTKVDNKIVIKEIDKNPKAEEKGINEAEGEDEEDDDENEENDISD